MKRYIEDTLQKSCVQWFDLQYGHLSWALFHVPNGGQRNAKEAAKFKAMGVRAGVPDLILLHRSGAYSYLALELKAGKNTQTANQKTYQSKMEADGGKYAVIRSIDDFIETVNEYLHQD
jgi:hypothetical protein